MSSYVSTADIARAAGVSQRHVQLFLKAKYTLPVGEKWRFSQHELPDLVETVVAARKRRRKNSNNTPKPTKTHWSHE
jgi:hypothetical protein